MSEAKALTRVRAGATAVLLAAWGLVQSAPAAVTAPRSWAPYGNSRFNFAICHPPAFRPQGEADDGDGQRFRTSDGAALAAYGSNQGPGEKIDSDLGASIKDLGGADAHVTYRARQANWLVVSGTGARGEFYLKRILRNAQLINWELVYPVRLHARYAALTPQMLACFTAGSEDGE